MKQKLVLWLIIIPMSAVAFIVGYIILGIATTIKAPRPDENKTIDAELTGRAPYLDQPSPDPNHLHAPLY